MEITNLTWVLICLRKERLERIKNISKPLSRDLNLSERRVFDTFITGCLRGSNMMMDNLGVDKDF